MNVARRLERRLERLLDTAGKMFSGRLHPSEIADRLTREADLARFQHGSGPATANRYQVVMSPRDIDAPEEDIAAILRDALARHVDEAGLRLEGPLAVFVESSRRVAPGELVFRADVEPGPQAPWALLIGTDETVELGPNRAVVGRAATADAILPHDDVSRAHALVWREGGKTWITDLGSANGTATDEGQVRSEPREIRSGDTVVLSGHRYRFKEL